jgi:hypothetical protein
VIFGVLLKPVRALFRAVDEARQARESAFAASLGGRSNEDIDELLKKRPKRRS